MIELIQFPWSPFCLVQRRILEYARVPFKIVNVPLNDRSRVWRMTKRRYYQVPVIKDGKGVIFEADETSQVIAKYLDQKLGLNLFPREYSGMQQILWGYIESDVEGLGFKLNDIYWKELVKPADQLGFLRHKERKFGRGCLDQWRADQALLIAELTRKLVPFEQMLLVKPYLLGAQPCFVDFDLFGMLGNFLYSGHYELPAAHTQIKQWHERMGKVKCPTSACEKLHS